jgi:hypothetical protein
LEPKLDTNLLHELTKRGITEKASIALLKNLQPDQQVMDQLEWGDYLVIHSSKRHKFYNPADLYIHLVRENAIPPEPFETRRMRKLREEAQMARKREEEEKAALELAYMKFKDDELDRYIDSHYTSEELSAFVEAKKKEMLQQTYWKRIANNHCEFHEAARRQVRISFRGQVPIMSFSEFCEVRLREHRQHNPSDAPFTSSTIAPPKNRPSEGSEI